MQPWAVPAPTLSAPSRKAPEREADDPEGNLAIVERVVRESQRLFPYWEHSWAGTAHRSASTPYGTPRITALWSNTSHNHIAIVERVVRESQRPFPYRVHSWAGTAHRSASTRNSASGARERRLIACQRTSVIYSIVPAAMESGGHLHFHCSATVRTPDAISASPQRFSAGGLAHA